MADSIASPGHFEPKNEENTKKYADNTDVRSLQHGENDLLQGEIVDQVLAAKMNLINDVSSANRSICDDNLKLFSC